jgi:hypothetical protein
MVRRINIDGDDQADRLARGGEHRAVFVYQIESSRCHRRRTHHNCESGLVAGAVTYNEGPLEPPPEGRVLACCSQPASELALDL